MSLNISQILVLSMCRNINEIKCNQRVTNFSLTNAQPSRALQLHFAQNCCIKD